MDNFRNKLSRKSLSLLLINQKICLCCHPAFTILSSKTKAKCRKYGNVQCVLLSGFDRRKFSAREENMNAIEKPVMICHVEKPLTYTLYDCKWIPKTAKFVVVGTEPRGTGVIEVFEVGANDVTSINKVKPIHTQS